MKSQVMEARERIHSLDGFRAVAILLVVASHYTKAAFIPSGFGVTIFFVISGFLITSLLINEYEKTGTIDRLAFYKRRFFRLMPAIVVALIVVALIEDVAGKDWIDFRKAMASLAFVQNYNLNWSQFSGPVGQHWSLAVEEHFYLIFPLLLLWLVSSRRPVVRVLLAVCLACLVLRCSYVMFLDLDDQLMRERIYRSSETRIDSILFGCIVALMARGEWLKRHAGIWMIVAGVALMVVTRTFADVPEFRDTLKFTLQPMAVSLALAGVIYGDEGKSILIWLARQVLNCHPMVFIGNISFSLYLLHTAMNHLAASLMPYGPHDWQAWAPSLALAIAASWACYELVEKPCIRFGKSISVRSHFSEQGA